MSPDVVIRIAADPDFCQWADSRAAARASWTPAPLPSAPKEEEELWVPRSVAAAHPLHASRPVAPSAWQWHGVHLAVQRARYWGLKFPEFQVGFVDPNDEQHLGATTLEFAEGRLTLSVKLHARLKFSKFEGICLHELKHVLQIATGEILTRAEAEEAADEFAARVLAIPPAWISRDALEPRRGW